MNESEWEDLPELYVELKNNLDKIFIISTPPSYMDPNDPDTYLIYLKDGRKLVVDRDQPEYYFDISDMSILDKDIKGADVDDLDYEIIIPKGSLIYEFHPECDVFVALSPDLKKGLTTPGSGYEPIIMGKYDNIFENRYDDKDFAWIIDESGNKRKLVKNDFVFKIM